MSTAGDQVTWQELAGVVDALDLEPGYSAGTGRAFVVLADDSLLWAEVGGIRLDEHVPGANRLQHARILADMRKREAEDEAYLASLTDEQRERELDARRKFADQPDPPQHKIDAYMERHGGGRDTW